MSVRESMRLATCELLKAEGYTVLATSDRWNKYLDKASYPVCKLVADGTSKVLKEYAHRRKLREDTWTLYVDTWSTCADFEEHIGAQIDAMDQLLDPDRVRQYLPPELRDSLVSITAGEAQAIIPDARPETSTPYAMLKLTVIARYLGA